MSTFVSSFLFYSRKPGNELITIFPVPVHELEHDFVAVIKYSASTDFIYLIHLILLSIQGRSEYSSLR